MRILDDSKQLSVLATDITNGLGHIQPISAYVTEELNGMYECEFTISDTDKHFSDLKVGGIISTSTSQTSGEQMFRIYEIGKAINGICTIKCEHISYDLTKTVVRPFTATGAVSATNGMLTHVIGSTPFTMTTDITNTTSVFDLKIPRSFRECLGGYEGSLLDVFRGEYEWKNLTVEMLAHRGADNGVRVAYGKNLTDFNQEENNQNVFTAVLAYAVVDEQTYVGDVYNKIQTTYPKIKIIDVSGDYQTGEVPTTAQLNAKAQSYATNNDIEIPKINIKVSFVSLWQTEEYKDILPLERVSLGDTVHVFFEKLNVEATARVIKTVWNVNLERYDEIELGDARANLNTVINESVDSAVNNAIGDLDIDTGAIESEMFQMSKLIANGMGLHMTKDSIGRIFLHNAEDLSQSQYQYQITSNGFMLSDDYGQTWNSGWTTSGEAVVNSLATITLKFLEGYGMYMRFGDINSNYIEVAPYSENNVPQGVSFDGSGSVRFQPQNEFLVRNIGANDSLYNRIFMKHQSTQNRVLIENYNYSNPANMANYVQLISNSVNNASSIINRKLSSNQTGNSISLGSYSSSNQNSVTISNYKMSENELCNQITLMHTTSSQRIDIENGKWNDGNSTYNTNYISLQRASTSSYIYQRNRMPSTNSDANHLIMKSENGQNSVELENYDSNGNIMNYLRFNNQNNQGTAELYAKNDLLLSSGGAVRISSSNQQDIDLNSVDSLHFRYTDKWHVIYVGVDRVLSFGTDGNVKWAYAS